MPIETFTRTVSVTAGPGDIGQIVDVASATETVTLRNGTTAAVQYRLSDSPTWTNLPVSTSAQVQADLSKQRLMLRRASTALSAPGVVIRGTKGEATAAPIGTGNRLLLIGSSTLEYHSETTGSPNRTALTVKGPLNWLNAMAERPLSLVKNMGVGGYNAAQVLTQVDEALTYRPDVVAVHAGTNGLFMNSNTAAVEFDGIRQICERFLAAGCKVLLCLPQRWASTDANYSVAKAQQHTDFLNMIRNYGTGKANLLLLNFAGPIVDPSSATGDALAGALVDTRHLSNNGALLIADANYEAFARFLPPVSRPIAEQANLLPDPGMWTTKAANQTGVTGVSWNHFDVKRLAGVPNVTLSMVPAPDGTGMAQKLSITATANNDRVNAEILSSLVMPLISVGDRVQVGMRMQVLSHTNLRSLPVYVSNTHAGGTMNVIDLGRDLNTAVNDKTFRSGGIRPLKLATPAYDVPVGTSTFTIAFSALFNGAGAAEILLWDPRLMKVPSEPRFY